MNPLTSTFTRGLFGALAALMVLPAMPVQAEGPIDHIQRRRRQIHEKIGEIFFGLGRKLEHAADRVEGRVEVVPVPPPPGYRGSAPYRDDPSWEGEDPNLELDQRYQRRTPRGPGLTYPDGTPYPDATDRQTYRERDLSREPRDPYYGPRDQYNSRGEYRPPVEPYDSRRPAPMPSESPFGSDPKSGAPSGSVTKPGTVPMPDRKAGDASTASSAEGGLRYGRPVPGRQGFVYPPGVKEESKNMIDVRDFRSGQKVKDPRTGEMFLVP